jgi:hypothetical protein
MSSILNPEPTMEEKAAEYDRFMAERAVHEAAVTGPALSPEEAYNLAYPPGSWERQQRDREVTDPIVEVPRPASLD